MYVQPSSEQEACRRRTPQARPVGVQSAVRVTDTWPDDLPLTPAELRLLPYLQTHLTMAEIGRRLFVSRNTVSTQVGAIYRKLGATTRGAAVERAVTLGLLGS